jgi:16S rRNA (adenine1518-N6/adenine1519-N6)-dimethyltransferase
MKFLKKSLGQNFLVDKNIIKKIVNSLELKNKDIVEIGPGNGALTNEILKCNPKSLILIEKDNNFAKHLKEKYSNIRQIKIFNSDILKFDIEKYIKKKSIIYGNLPYNISSQILVKFLKFSKWPPKYNDLIFMFQKELGEKITGNYPGKHYGRLSILTNLKLSVYKSFFVSPNCFHPKPKVDSTVIHFKPKINTNLNIKNINNLEKITNIFFSNKRKMINKNIKKILNKNQISLLIDLDLSLRPAEIRPEMYYKITELYEEK